MKRLIPLLIIPCLLACTGEIRPDNSVDELPAIFPDYINVTVPINIAPLNFNYVGNLMPEYPKGFGPANKARFAAKFESGEYTFTIRAKNSLISIPERQWSQIKTGEQIKVTCFLKERHRWKAFKPFVIEVSQDRIDPYIAYRLIPPGYEVWGEMGIYQRNLENYEESAIIDNSNTETNCMNCHSFAGRDPETFLFHMRSKHGGTYLIKDKKIEKLNTKTPETLAALVYPQWSVQGKYVAFSVNNIAQFFHSKDPNKIEVYDSASDVVVYDVDNHSITFSPLTKSEDYFETFPTFSPDGDWLYFCRSKAVEKMPQDYKNARYNIVRVPFDSETGTIGQSLETVYDAEAGNHSVTFPRISPDGRFLVVTRIDYGQFPIWHKEAQLFLIDLETGEKRELDAFNSDDADSYHGWSSNGRWMVFSSRRDDGQYTKPYIGHIDGEGNPSKPFLLPQNNPHEFYLSRMTSFNLPDFITGKVTVSKEELESVALNDKGIDITVRH